MRLTLMVVVLALGACSPDVRHPPGSDGGADGGFDAGADAGNPGADGGLAVAVACSLLTERRCAALDRCGVISDSQAAQRDCVAYFTATWCGPTLWPSRVDPSVATLHYDPARAQACADAWPTRACPDWNTEPDACTRFLTPNAQPGQACYGGYQECVIGVCRGDVCPRTCKPKGIATDPCQLTTDCRAGLYCRITTSGAGTGRCTEYGLLAASCDPTLPCADMLLCLQGTCQALPGAGQGCLAGRCDDTAYCVTGADGGVCEPKRNTGAPCSDDSQCLPGDVCETLSASCEPSVLTQAGAPCGARQLCPTGMVCLGLRQGGLGECQPPAAPGQPCVSSDDCQAQLACGRVDGGLVCGPLRAAGQACAATRDCQAFTVCLGNTCTPLPTVGAACSTTRQCQWGTCLDTGDGGLMCSSGQGPGAHCSTGSDCASGRCEAGQCLAACSP